MTAESDKSAGHIILRQTESRDFPGVIELCKIVYPSTPPWNETQLASHLEVFPKGQIVAVDEDRGKVVGMSASLVVLWDDYDSGDNWRDFTDHGMFTNHDPKGRTLYGAEIMVHPDMRGRGIGGRIYGLRRCITEDLGLLRIRAGARMRGYHKHVDVMEPREYLKKVARGELRDPTISFQIRHGFRPIKLISNYLRNDPESLGYAALIEWLNEQVATPDDVRNRSDEFAPSIAH